MSSLSPRALLPVLIVALCAGVATAGALIEPEPAPDWQISEWLNDNPGSLTQQRGKVVLIEFFQLWCPGCDAFSIPLFASWHDRWADSEDVLVVSIHTVFEGHEQQSPERLRAFVAERGIDHPVGIDAYRAPGDEVPITMDRFSTEGTPHVVIVDRDGQIVFSHFGRFAAPPVEAFIERLIKVKPSADKKPAKRVVSAGQEATRATRKPPASSARKPSRPPRRQAPPRRTGRAADRKADAPTEDDAPDDGSEGNDGEATDIAGTYRISFEQTDKSCGSPIPPLTMLADLIVHQDQMEIRVRRPFLGLHKIPATVNLDTGDFRAASSGQSREAGAVVELTLELSGSVSTDVDPPTLDYEFVVEKTGPTPDWSCTIEGRGDGTRTAAARR